MNRINRIKEYLREIKTKKQSLQDLVKPITEMHQKEYSEWIQIIGSKPMEETNAGGVQRMESEPEKNGIY